MSMMKRWLHALAKISQASGRAATAASHRLVGFLTIATTFVAPCAYADCNGFLNVSEQGYKLEGARLEPSGPKVAAGTELEFNGIARVQDRFFLTRARSDVMFDSENVELTAGCDLPTRSAPQAR